MLKPLARNFSYCPMDQPRDRRIKKWLMFTMLYRALEVECEWILVACTRLYNLLSVHQSVCQRVCSVRPSVNLSVNPSVCHTTFLCVFTDGVCITAPVHQHATWVAVYPALLHYSPCPGAPPKVSIKIGLIGTNRFKIGRF